MDQEDTKKHNQNIYDEIDDKDVKNIDEDSKNNAVRDDTVIGNSEETDEVIVIHKKEKNPIIKFAIGFVVFIVVAYVTLFAVGFTMGLMGKQVPTIDPKVGQNKWSEVTGEKNTETPSEIETVKPTDDNKSE